jgi:hypothetical protein
MDTSVSNFLEFNTSGMTLENHGKLPLIPHKAKIRL